MQLTRQLHLTTPLQHGSDIEHAQQLLGGGNVFQEDYYTGTVDGDYGVLSMQACKRAEYWLGFLQDEIDGSYGQRLEDFLTGDKQLPSAFAQRRTTRLAAKKQAERRKPLGEKVVTRSAKDVGKKESPAGSNKMTGVTDWYGIVGPWCAMQVTRWYVDCGSTAFKKGVRYSYVPFMVHDATAGINGLTITRSPEPGDVVTYDWDDDGIADHTGIFLHWTDQANGKFMAREGNTAVGNNSNGGEVMDRARSTADVKAFIHVTA